MMSLVTLFGGLKNVFKASTPLSEKWSANKFSGENVFDGHVCVPAPLQGHDGPFARLLPFDHCHSIGHRPHHL